jgi:hypothetical protein
VPSNLWVTIDLFDINNKFFDFVQEGGKDKMEAWMQLIGQALNVVNLRMQNLTATIHLSEIHGLPPADLMKENTL